MQDLQELISELGACVLAVSMHAHTYTPRRGGGEAGRAWGGGGGKESDTELLIFLECGSPKVS